MATVQTEITAPTLAPAPVRAWRAFWNIIRQLAARPLSLLGLIIVTLFLLMAIFGPIIAPYPFDAAIKGAARHAPSAQYLFGVDRSGRDVFSRVLWGARDIITLPLLTSILAVIFGTCIGLTIGYFGGWIDEAVSRVLDTLLAIPALVLALIMLGVFGPSPVGIVIVIVLLYTPIVARVVRAATLNIRSYGFIEAAKLRGESTPYILFREILPGVLPALAVEGALRFSYAIFLTASLGFLGLGVQPPSPDWGRMVNEARASFTQTPWALWAPAGAIALLVIGVNLLSDGLRRIFRYEGQIG
ncbi:MAG TPA: ABC transporter permease [Phototrophicaceae bacterium]|nr:ABC transporter permease [Phototrophicaceae bacterium]